MSFNSSSLFGRLAKKLPSFTIAAAAATLLMAASTSATAQVSTDVFDVSQGGSVSNASATIAGFGPIGIIGGPTAGEGGAGNTIFSGVGPNLVTINTSTLVTLTGVNLFTRSDMGTSAPTANRGTSSFSFFADTDNNGSFETQLVGPTDPNDTGAANTYLFSAVTASSFQASFTGNTNPVGGPTFVGPRIVELDAIGTPVPEPGEWATMGIAAMSVCGLMLRARRRRTQKSAA